MSYPTIAVSDAFNALGHWYAAAICYENGNLQGAAGFSLVAIAASVGTLRFGLSEKIFCKANSDLADLATFVGLPLIGNAFGSPAQEWTSGVFGKENNTYFILLSLVVFYTSFQSMFSKKSVELLKIPFNLCLFVLPVVKYAVDNGDMQALAAILLFTFAGVVVGADRYVPLFGGSS